MFFVEFDASQCVVKDKLMKEFLVQCHLHNGLYQLHIPRFRSTNMLPNAYYFFGSSLLQNFSINRLLFLQ